MVRWTTELQHGEYNLQFANEIQCISVVERVRLRTRESFEEEQSFILKYVQGCYKELKVLKEDS